MHRNLFKKLALKEMLISTMFSSLIIILSFLKIPLPFSPIPLTGQTFAIMLTGLVLSPIQAFIAVGVYILLGLVGIPVFSGGTSGIGVLAGPTGGYLIGFLIGAVVISIIRNNKDNILRMAIAGAAGGIVVVYLTGVFWLSQVKGLDIIKAFSLGAVPFIPGDIFKLIVAVIVAQRVNARLKSSKQASK
jgi:biotin transport system substrate-specific component